VTCSLTGFRQRSGNVDRNKSLSPICPWRVSGREFLTVGDRVSHSSEGVGLTTLDDTEYFLNEDEQSCLGPRNKFIHRCVNDLRVLLSERYHKTRGESR
jgi:hypothetical protein